MARRLVIGFLLCTLLAGCQISFQPKPTLRPAALGQPFTLAWGETATLADAGLDVTFDTILNDGRCPSQMECYATMPVVVAITVKKKDSGVWSTLTLQAHTTQSGDVVPSAPDSVLSDRYGAYTISLARVAPYPATRDQLASRDYRVTLLVSPTDASTPVAISTDVPTPASTSTAVPTAEATWTAVPTPEPPLGPIMPVGKIDVALGQPFSLSLGQMARLPDHALALTFEQVTEDSRCPTDVMCAWSGAVKVQMVAEMPSQAAQTLILGGGTDVEGNVYPKEAGPAGPSSVWLQGYSIELTRVTPYPIKASETVPLSDYRLTLLVTAAKEPGPSQTPVPTAVVFPTDPQGLPLLCVSEWVLTQRMAGATQDEPVQLTPPIASQTLVSQDAVDQLCVALFGENWYMAELDSLDGMWAPYLPSNAQYWLWDWQRGAPVAAP